jgi:hypothetical protein
MVHILSPERVATSLIYPMLTTKTLRTSMQLSALADIATIVESFFVIVSVLFIWREVRENTRLTKAANMQSLVELTSPFNMQLIQDRKLAEYWVHGAKTFPEMDEVEKYRYHSMLTWWLILHENIYYQWKNKLLDNSVYAGWVHDLETFVKEQNLWLFWGNMKDTYQPDFANFVNCVVEKSRKSLCEG